MRLPIQIGQASFGHDVGRGRGDGDALVQASHAITVGTGGVQAPAAGVGVAWRATP